MNDPRHPDLQRGHHSRPARVERAPPRPTFIVRTFSRRGLFGASGLPLWRTSSRRRQVRRQSGADGPRRSHDGWRRSLAVSRRGYDARRRGYDEHLPARDARSGRLARRPRGHLTLRHRRAGGTNGLAARRRRRAARQTGGAARWRMGGIRPSRLRRGPARPRRERARARRRPARTPRNEAGGRRDPA